MSYSYTSYKCLTEVCKLKFDSFSFLVLNLFLVNNIKLLKAYFIGLDVVCYSLSAEQLQVNNW